MPFTFFRRSACCIAVAALMTPLIQAQEFKPFLAIQTASPNVLIDVAESVAAVFDPADTAGLKEQLAPFKHLAGVNVAGTIGLALQVNKEAPYGLDAVIVLPINNLQTFAGNLTNFGIEPTMLMSMMQAQPGGKYVIPSPLGGVVAYQKQGFFIIATEGAADFAAVADPKKLFAELEAIQNNLTLGITVNLANITLDDVEMVLEKVAPMLAMFEMDIDPENIMEISEMSVSEVATPSQMQLITDTASFSLGITLDPKTLNTTVSTLQVPRKDSPLAEKFLKTKETPTQFAGFLHDTPKTVFSFSYLDYLTDAEIKDVETAIELMTEGFMEGLLESVDDNEDGVAAALFAEALVQWMTDAVDYFGENKMLDAVVSLDSDGTLLYAQAIEPALMKDLAERLFSLVPFMMGDGEKVQELLTARIETDYETVAGYSLSGLPNVFADAQEDSDIPAAVRNLPLSFYWAVKEDKAVALAVGLGAEKTEVALKAALTASSVPENPKHTALIALKPIGELLQAHLPSLQEALGEASEADIEQGKEMFGKLAAMDVDAKMMIVQEFPDDANLVKYQFDGKVFTAFQILMQPAIEAAQGAAKRMQCSNHLKQIGLALHNYHYEHNAFPSLYTVDADGKPLQSWRVLILPFIEEARLYDEMIAAGAMTKPWDHEDMKSFHNRMPVIFSCPDNPGAGCTYSAIAGQGLIPATAAGRLTGHSFAALVDGTSYTIAVVEVKQPFNWMDPTADIDLAELAKGINKPDGKVGSFHEGGTNILLFDAAVRFVADTVDPAILRALGNIRDGVPVSLP